MKTTHQKADKRVKRGTIDITKVFNHGHQPRQSGAGQHKNKSERRLGTRSQYINRMVNDE